MGDDNDIYPNITSLEGLVKTLEGVRQTVGAESQYSYGPRASTGYVELRHAYEAIAKAETAIKGACHEIIREQRKERGRF